MHYKSRRSKEHTENDKSLINIKIRFAVKIKPDILVVSPHNCCQPKHPNICINSAPLCSQRAKDFSPPPRKNCKLNFLIIICINNLSRVQPKYLNICNISAHIHSRRVGWTENVSWFSGRRCVFALISAFFLHVNYQI